MGYFTKHMRFAPFKFANEQEINANKNFICCGTMLAGLLDGRTAIKYEPRLREYWLIGQAKDIYIEYCPWCQTTLPQELRETFAELLSNIGIEDVWDEDDVNIPQEFKSDEWWKKRGL
jgi:hypothetical protein